MVGAETITEAPKREPWRVTGRNRKTGFRLNIGVFLAIDRKDAIRLASIRHGARMVKCLVLDAHRVASEAVAA